MTLQDYNRKRRFNDTPEPDGHALAEQANARPRFVVQEHHASRLHYDFRLEIAGVLKSWAIPRGPSPDPTVKRLAVQVEDHPLEYAGFTGTIPPGNYGAGEVFLWDQGTFTLREEDAEKAWEAGALHLTLRGQKLRGKWLLFRTKQGKRPQWLLQKAVDGYAEPSYDGPEHEAPAADENSDTGKTHATSVGGVRRTSSPGPRDALSAEEFLARRAPSGNITLQTGNERLRLTNLERVYWPKDGITKGDLLKYYLKIAPFILPFLTDRAAILKRYPDGIDQPAFHQHDLATAPEFLRVYTDTQRKSRPVNYAVYTDTASLLYLVNLGSIEQHPWHARLDQLEHPDWSVIDMDPQGTPWKELVRAALEVRTAIESMGLPSFLKTSGSRGIHVYIPLKPVYTYEQASGLAEAVCRIVNERLPKTTTVERRVEARKKGDIYLDWMQNAGGKTVASAYSVRARPSATVSCPITWDELGAGARTEDFTIHSVPERLESGVEPWAGLFAAAARIPDTDSPA